MPFAGARTSKTLHQAHQICPQSARRSQYQTGLRARCPLEVARENLAAALDQTSPRAPGSTGGTWGRGDGIIQGGEVRTTGKQFSQSLRYL